MVSQKPKYCKNFERNSHWRKLSMIMVWECYCNASPKPEFFLFSLFIFSFISQLIWVRLGWNFHRWFSIQKQVNWCTIDPFSLKFCTSQHSYPVPLIIVLLQGFKSLASVWIEFRRWVSDIDFGLFTFWTFHESVGNRNRYGPVRLSFPFRNWPPALSQGYSWMEFQHEIHTLCSRGREICRKAFI